MIPELPEIPLHERTRTVDLLLQRDAQRQEIMQWQQEQIVLQQEQLALQQEQIQALKDEIARLKGQNPKPKIRPSMLEKDGSKNTKKDRKNSKTKRSKTKNIDIHQTVVIRPNEKIPAGSRFKGYADFTVVGLKFEPYNIRYRLQTWVTPDGKFLKGKIATIGKRNQSAIGCKRA